MNLPIVTEDVFEVVLGIYLSRCHITHNTCVFTMQYHGTIEDDEEQVDVTRVSEVSRHHFKHSGN